MVCLGKRDEPACSTKRNETCLLAASEVKPLLRFDIGVRMIAGGYSAPFFAKLTTRASFFFFSLPLPLLLFLWSLLAFACAYPRQVVERARGEAEESRGQMQATCYAIRFAGNVIGCVGGALVFNREAWGWGLTFRQVRVGVFYIDQLSCPRDSVLQ